jgi:large subunit ribosomal protein L6
MSRIGKNPVAIPEKVNVGINGSVVTVKGPKGELTYEFTSHVTIEQKDSSVVVSPVDQSKLSRSLWGTTRTIISNMISGVSTGFVKSLEFNGVGYKAVVKGSQVELNLGYSHPIVYDLPEGISAKVEKNVIHLSGCNKEILGQAAAKIRSFRPPEPYKGKGVKYTTETIIRKAGKAGGK